MKNPTKKKQLKRERRAKRARVKIFGGQKQPRLVLSRSLRHIYAQIIDDTRGKTLVAASDFELSMKKKAAKKEIAKAVGALIAKKAKEKKVEKVVLDRRGRKYHGAIKEFADSAREGGLKF